MLSVIILSVAMLSVIILSVFMPDVVASIFTFGSHRDERRKKEEKKKVGASSQC